MAKSVLISIRPEWVKMILNGEKTLEIRKTCPKLETPFKCYIYCTQASVKYQTICGCRVLNSDELYRHPEQGIKHGSSIELMLCENYTKNNFLNGKVIAEFTCDRCDRVEAIKAATGPYGIYAVDDDFVAQARLGDGALWDYGKGATLYGWHVSNLEIYDTPKKLDEFSRPFENCIGKVCDEYGCAYCENGGHIKRPPQSWCYVEELK